MLEDVARRTFARAALTRLDRAWPETATLDIFSLGAGTDEHQFALDVQFLVDQGLVQYELVMIAGMRSLYRYASITQHGRELMRSLRARA
ncbi:hypothetical protein [Sphingomonas gilva]|nr:hypothetical protein [Sphingomonas gilva]